jgi:hypothetical protein
MILFSPVTDAGIRYIFPTLPVSGKTPFAGISNGFVSTNLYVPSSDRNKLPSPLFVKDMSFQFSIIL